MLPDIHNPSNMPFNRRILKMACLLFPWLTIVQRCVILNNRIETWSFLDNALLRNRLWGKLLIEGIFCSLKHMCTFRLIIIVNQISFMIILKYCREKRRKKGLEKEAKFKKKKKMSFISCRKKIEKILNISASIH